MENLRIEYPDVIKTMAKEYPWQIAEGKQKSREAQARLSEIEVEEIFKYLLTPERFLRLMAETERRGRTGGLLEVLDGLVDSLPPTPQAYLDVAPLIFEEV